MKRWQPINTVPLDTPVIVTDGRSRRMAVLKSQKPVWEYEPESQAGFCKNQINGLPDVYRFTPTHWFSLPKMPEEK